MCVYIYNVIFIILYKIDKGIYNIIFIIIINVKFIYYFIIIIIEDCFFWGNFLLYCMYL